MLGEKPDGYTDATGMTHSAEAARPAPECGRLDGPGIASATVVAEQEAKNVEKIRSHASSHRCAGTVSVDAAPADPGTSGMGTMRSESSRMDGGAGDDGTDASTSASMGSPRS